MQVIRLLLSIKISLLLLLAGCAHNNAWHTQYDGRLKIVTADKEEIQRSWEAWSGQTTKVRGWARWGQLQDGSRWCEIHVPFIENDLNMKTWEHEMRHCQEGHFHKGPTTVGYMYNDEPLYVIQRAIDSVTDTTDQ